MSRIRVDYCVYEINEASAPLECFPTEAEAQREMKRSNQAWRKNTGLIWILWWILNGGNMRYAVRRDVWDEPDPAPDESP